jgi:hypothetical protein
MIATKRLVLVAVAGTALAVGTATPALADLGGIPNKNSCGGIGRVKPTGPFDPNAFTCDDTGQSNASSKASGPGQGFPAGSTNGRD